MKKIIKYIKKPKKIMLYAMSKNYFNIFNLMNDKRYLELKYKLIVGEKLNLEDPKTFNEKIQWLKLYDRNPEYTKMVDKYEAKKYVGSIIGEKYIIPIIGVYNTFEEINFEKLPNEFVIKCTHDSGGVIICKDKNQFNIKKSNKVINKYLKRNYYYSEREWPYKNVKPRIIVEKYMKNQEEDELKDYKFFCFNGKVKVVLVCSNRSKGLKETFFDNEWNELQIIEGNHLKEKNLKKPNTFEEMKKISELLSENIPFLRVDFYEIKNQLYFGELTFYPKSGYEEFTPKEYDKILGDMLQLPEHRIEEENEK